VTEYAHDHRIATDYHVNETPMLEQDEHFKHLSENPMTFSYRSNLAPQHSVQIECSANQCEMCKCLREITESLALRPGLF
jgi:hypothetical protein